MSSTDRFWSNLNAVTGTFVSAAIDSIQLFHFDGKLRNLELITSSYHPWIHTLRQRGLSVSCLSDHSDEPVKTTAQLLKHPDTLRILSSLPKPVRVMMFKPDSRTVEILKNHQIQVIGCNPSVARRLENKLNFPQLAHGAGLDIPPTMETITPASPDSIPSECTFSRPFICQFAKGFSGNRTFIIRTQEDWNLVCERFPKRHCRLSQYLSGDTWTVNSCILKDGRIICSVPFLQKTEIIRDPETNLPDTAGSRGNIWGLTPPQPTLIQAMKQLGKALFEHGYTGFWGADLLLSKTENGHEKVFAIEVNPRITASASVLTSMEIHSDVIPLSALHLAVFSDCSIPSNIATCQYPSGGQIIVRGNQPDGTAWESSNSGLYTISDADMVYQREEVSPGLLCDNELLLWKPVDKDVSNETLRLIFRSETGQLKNLSDLRFL